jgi:transaldolase
MGSIKILLDTSDLAEIRKFKENKDVSGFTTNPSLMRKSGVTDYHDFVLKALAEVDNLPISFEVVSDTTNEMFSEAKILQNMGTNVWVKIPVIDSHGNSNIHLINQCIQSGMKVNVTAVFLIDQLEGLVQTSKENCIISIFCGRIADTGVDPEKTVRDFKKSDLSKFANLLWASVREVFNIIQAQRSGCDMVTVQPEILAKTQNFGKDLLEYSRETVNMFVTDAKNSNLKISIDKL